MVFGNIPPTTSRVGCSSYPIKDAAKLFEAFGVGVGKINHEFVPSVFFPTDMLGSKSGTTRLSKIIPFELLKYRVSPAVAIEKFVSMVPA